ncbi:adenylate/guanylate cyclase domain-containing protein [Acuticoccus sp. I52.16.1]|uniref:adenylate/guanylate cyclase domain-containing protein n=1 Tax=Acuticoccus sp. I52.16.1 TaxID=2928472 RepID=UPI001FD57129|nr:adenylate/guanylate cyclase domain-containing protein [Acuticoccus sp. I52.16.1]UOM34197.1 adenylate/guanylate cyclase domain-containing protein [Acuticoccus sp. I52.16.1]
MKVWRRIGRARGRAATEAGLVAIAALVTLLLVAFSGTDAGSTLRERTFDTLTATVTLPPEAQPVVVDIDRAALARVGRWPWGRADLAALVEAIAAAGAGALAVDILLDEPDDRSPAALARRLAAAGVPLPVDAASLEDGDQRLAAAFASLPTVLGVGLAPQEGESVRPPPVIVRGTFVADGLWVTGGIAGPIPALKASAAGFGALSLPGSVDGSVRRVPLLAIAGRQPVTGLAVELHRVVRGGPPILIDPAARVMQVGERTVAMGTSGLMRLVPVARAARQARHVDAAAVLDGDPAALARLAGAAVFLGSSAPELGGLRTGADGTLVPSVDLQADAYAQIGAGAYPLRADAALTVERVAIALGAVLGLLAARFLTPASGTVAVGIAVVMWAAGAASASAYLHLFDPILPAAGTALTFALGSLLVAARARRQARRVQAAFEQHLSPAVVRRIAASPDAVRLKGEARVVTALFTDIEGFSSMTAAAEPEALIGLLDAYYDVITNVAVAHEGMVAKLIGDSMNALFNVPVDLADHPRRALECAVALAEASARFEATPEARALGLGRTRIGLDTGRAIVGDVGGSRKLDYTAHGAAVNAASRFEQANKFLGTQIVIGPGTAAALEMDLRPLGRFVVRGFPEPLALFTLWDDAMGEAEKETVRRAVAALSAEPLVLDDLKPARYAALLAAQGDRSPADAL